MDMDSVKGNMEEMKDKMDQLTRDITNMLAREVRLIKVRLLPCLPLHPGMVALYKDLLLTSKGEKPKMVPFTLNGLSQPLFTMGYSVPYKYQFCKATMWI